MDFLQRTPFFRLFLPLSIGIIFYQYVDLPQWSLLSLLVFSVCVIYISFKILIPNYQYQFRWLFGFGIFLFIFSFSYLLNAQNDQRNNFDHYNRNGIYQIELTSAPIEKAKSYQCKVKVFKYFNANLWQPANGNAMLYFQKNSDASKLLFGDRLMISTEFSKPEGSQNPDGFDYGAYLERQGINASSFISSDKWKIIGRNNSFSIRRQADRCRMYLLNVYRKFDIQGDEFAVLAALTLGYTDALNPDIRASYSASGAMHILAVSGLHVGVVYLVLAFLLSFMNKSQKQKVIKTILIALFLWFYAFLTGLSPSVTRATLMFTFIAVATCLERKSQIYNTIFMSAFIMLIFNPDNLFNVGFQLSYSAVLSIIFFQPIIAKLYIAKNKISKFIFDLVTVSLAAQIGTAPFTLYYFQQFPNYFLLTNLVVIPLSTIIIYLAMALLAVSFIPYLSLFIAFLLKWSLLILNFLIIGIQHFPYSLSHISLDIQQMVLVILTIFFLTYYFYSKKYIALIAGLSSILLISIFDFMLNYKTMTSKSMIVFAGQKYTHINFINHNQNYVITSDSTEIKKIAKTFWQNHKLKSPQFLTKNSWCSDGFVCFGGSRILILNEKIMNKASIKTPLEIDYMIIGESLKPKIDQLLEYLHPRKIIVDKSISTWYTENIKRACKKRNIDFYSVAERGAFILNFSD